jgi:hypothetical protein
VGGRLRHQTLALAIHKKQICFNCRTQVMKGTQVGATFVQATPRLEDTRCRLQLCSNCNYASRESPGTVVTVTSQIVKTSKDGGCPMSMLPILVICHGTLKAVTQQSPTSFSTHSCCPRKGLAQVVASQPSALQQYLLKGLCHQIRIT